jgi:hypothetical protein
VILSLSAAQNNCVNFYQFSQGKSSVFSSGFLIRACAFSETHFGVAYTVDGRCRARELALNLQRRLVIPLCYLSLCSVTT